MILLPAGRLCRPAERNDYMCRMIRVYPYAVLYRTTEEEFVCKPFIKMEDAEDFHRVCKANYIWSYVMDSDFETGSYISFYR